MKTNFSQEAWHNYETNADFMATALGEKMFNTIMSGTLDDVLTVSPTFLSVDDTINMLSRKCPCCGKICEDANDKEWIDDYGYCLMCDKEKGETNNYYEEE